MAIEEIPVSEDHAATLAPEVERQHSLWRDALRSTLRRKSSVVGLVLLGLLVALAVFAPLLAPYGEREVMIPEGARRGTRPASTGACPGSRRCRASPGPGTSSN